MFIDGGGGATAPPPNIAQALAKLQAGQGTINDQATIMNGSAANLVAAAGTGFTLDSEAATALIASCDEALKLLSNAEQNVFRVQEAPKLGGTKGAQTVSSFTHKVASDSQGIAHAIQNLQGTIAQMRDAYKKAVANYQAIEQQVTDSVHKLGQEVRQQNAPTSVPGPIRAV
ncbi:MAG TPA: hypothetical protein VHV49_08175 [Pseudonocardiaceae bacterium]|jgi:hypothetical protein|nr:hypothetical protein [Pseudonocardiaceae bacterium]